MKRILFFIIILIGFVPSAFCGADVEVYTIPLFIRGLNADSAWGFETASEIVSQEVVNSIGTVRGIFSPKLERVKASHYKDFELAGVAQAWKNNQVIDIKTFSQIEPAQDKVLIVASGVFDRKTKLITDVWDTLKFDIDFKIGSKYDILTKLVLIDNKEGIILWQKSYDYSMDSDYECVDDINFAYDEREKFRSYAKNIIARDAIENMSLRLMDKSIDYSSKALNKEIQDSGIGLKYYNNSTKRNPSIQITPPEQTMEERLRTDDSFEL